MATDTDGGRHLNTSPSKDSGWLAHYRDAARKRHGTRRGNLRLRRPIRSELLVAAGLIVLASIAIVALMLWPA